MQWLVIGVIVAMSVYGLFTTWLTYRAMRRPIPENVRDIYDEETYAKQTAYKYENLRFSLIDEVIDLVMWVVLLGVGAHAIFYEMAAEHTGNMYLRVFFMFAVVWLIFFPVKTALSAYSTFGIEAKYGFNKTSVGTFIRDLIISTIFSDILLTLGLLSLFLLLYGWLGNMVFIAFFFIICAFMLVMMFVNKFLLRLFYKLTPLEEGELAERIAELSKKLGYPAARIYVADFSRRTTKSNAMFTGFGKMKTVVLADNLVEKFTTDEILCILAHEIGHYKHKHLWRTMPFQLVTFGVIMALAYFIIGFPDVSLAFGFAEPNAAFALFVTFTLVMPLMVILGIPRAIISRKHEYEADRYGVTHVGAEHAISGMKKLYRENFGSLTPHPFVVFTTYSHPPASERIAAMAAMPQNK